MSKDSFKRKIERALRPERPQWTPQDVEKLSAGSRPRPLHGRGSPSKPTHDHQTVYVHRSVGEYDPYAARKLLFNHRVWPGTAYRAAAGECHWCGRVHYKSDGTPNARKQFCDMACRREFDLRADPKLMRRFVYDRDEGICQKCHAVFDYFEDDGWQADHIRPLFMARGDWSFWDPDNLQLLCTDPCHKDKSAADNRKYRAHRRRRRDLKTRRKR